MRVDMCKASAAAAGFAVVFSIGLTGLASGQSLSGQVSQEQQEMVPQDKFWPGAITKYMTMTPGSGQFSADHLRFGRQVVITLYNPNNYPMRFDTTQRLGKDYSWVIPANSQRTVSFRYWNPVSDEVKFLTYQDPSSLVVTQGSVKQPESSTALIGPPAPSVSAGAPVYPQVPSYTPSITPAPEQVGPQPSGSQGRSAVRGYW